MTATILLFVLRNRYSALSETNKPSPIITLHRLFIQFIEGEVPRALSWLNSRVGDSKTHEAFK
jgi:hypothetical protein